MELRTKKGDEKKFIWASVRNKRPRESGVGPYQN
jgi:hypothetical protein